MTVRTGVRTTSVTRWRALIATAPGPDGGVGSQLEMTRAKISIDMREKSRHSMTASQPMSGVVESKLSQLDAVLGRDLDIGRNEQVDPVGGLFHLALESVAKAAGKVD